ncbi:MAG: RnfABCDGE type electron transport complex subunit B [bacterium]|nr:RnfABCDGE type electron transport complex subunit B [bacterium]
MNIILYSAAVLGAMGLLLGLGLLLFARIFAVGIDPRVERILEALPGLNCGVCGFAGCAAMAEALASGKAKARQCAPGGPAVVEKVAAILGTAEAAAEPRVAVVRCQGGTGESRKRAVYGGVPDCVSAELLEEGVKACRYGCLWMGSCARACPFDAIRMGGDGLPRIIETRCTACGRCVEVCPRGIITLVPRSQKVYLGCMSRDKGKKVKELCAKGCIACGLCALPKVTPSRKVVMENNLPTFPADWEDFGTAVEKCPSGCFVVRAGAPGRG